jgi:hypothetical protein
LLLERKFGEYPAVAVPELCVPLSFIPDARSLKSVTYCQPVDRDYTTSRYSHTNWWCAISALVEILLEEERG